MKKQINDVFNKSLFFLKFRPRSEKEVRDNLLKYIKKNNLQEEMIEEVIINLRKLQFVDDLAFARYWVEQRQAFRPKGERVIRLELKQKGIDKAVIEKVISETFTPKSQVESITKLINKALLKYNRLDFNKRRQKVIEYLLRRGYIYSEISSVVDELVKKQ